MRVRLLQLLDLEPRQLRFGCDDHRIAPGVHLGGALLGIVPRGDALRDDVAVGDGAEVAAVRGGVPHRADAEALSRRDRGPPSACCARGALESRRGRIGARLAWSYMS